MSRAWRRRATALLLLMTASASFALRSGEAGTETVEWPLPGFPEPSGIVYHPKRGTLFLVGDEGDIGELSLDGKLRRQIHLGGDLESITIDPRSGLLYVAREGHEIVFEVRPDDFKILRRFTINRSFDGDPNYLRRGGDGIEGLTFVPDDQHPEGGVFWAVNQYDPPVLIRLSIPLRSSKEKFEIATIAKAVPMDSAPLSDLMWDAGNSQFLVVSALWRNVAVLDAEGVLRRSVHIPGFMPEGLTRLPGGRVAIAQDSGGVVLWSPESDPFGGGTTESPSSAAKVPAGVPEPSVLMKANGK